MNVNLLSAYMVNALVYVLRTNKQHCVLTIATVRAHFGERLMLGVSVGRGHYLPTNVILPATLARKDAFLKTAGI